MTDERDIKAYLTRADPPLGKLIKILVEGIGSVRITHRGKPCDRPPRPNFNPCATRDLP